MQLDEKINNKYKQCESVKSSEQLTYWSALKVVAILLTFRKDPFSVQLLLMRFRDKIGDAIKFTIDEDVRGVAIKFNFPSRDGCQEAR